MSTRHKRRRPAVEGLEARSLLSGTTITGTVFQDSYQDGVFDQSGAQGADGGLKNRTVFLDLNHDGKLDAGDPTAVTGTTGAYTLTATTTGTFSVRVVPLPGDVATGPDGAGASLTLTTGQATATADVPLFSGSAIVPLSPSALPFGTANPSDITAAVGGLYRIILGRQAASSEINGWTSTYNNGAGLAQIATSIFNSTEYDTKLVSSYYQNFLGRAGAQVDVSGWVSQLQAGRSAESVATAFLSSTEFSQLHTSDSAFVTTLYEDVLGREPLTSETTGWLLALGTRTSRAEVVADFVNSTEADQRAVSGFYTAFLDRHADTVGYNSDVNLLQGGGTEVALAVSLGSSAEYRADAHKTIRV